MFADQRQPSLRDSLVGQVLLGTGNVPFHIIDCIGEGGQGWVFRAHYGGPTGKTVVLKVLRPDVIAVEALRRFQREAEVLRMLSGQTQPNPYIVRFYDHAVATIPSPVAGREPIALPFTVLEYVDGSTLEKALADQKKGGRGMSAERLRRLLRQICQALDVVHTQKVVHRDLKPSNILLAYDNGVEVAKVTDFGLVKLVDMNLQKTAALAGASLGYAPPEQYEQGNKRVSARTDVFSLAAVVYEMLTTKPAFPFIDGENPLIIVTRILNGMRPSLLKTRATLAPEIEASMPITEALDRELGKALSADPNARHEGATDFWNAIEPPLRAALEEQRTAPRAQMVSPFEATGQQPAVPIPLDKPSAVIINNVDVKTGSAALAATEAQQAVPAVPAPPANAHDNDAWSWVVLTPAIAPNVLRGVSFNKTAEVAVGLSAAGLVRWERGSWVSVPMPAHVPRLALRGVKPMRDGSVLLFGEGGFVARHVAGGQTSIWRVPDPEITFLGALVEDNGITTLVGERPYRGTATRAFGGNTAGVVAQWNGDRLTVVGDAMGCARLHSVARLVGGQLVACGDWGAIVRLELGVVELVANVCDGHLLAIMARPEGGAYCVGMGGHALTLTPTLERTLEAVQTTKDLLCVAVSEDAQTWAGAGQARIVHRGWVDGAATWARISGDLGVSTDMIAIAAGPRTVRAIGNDGMVVEGRLAPG